jgi:hypothetical protein
MADFGSTSLSRLEGVKLITLYRAVAMAEYVTRHGGDIGIPDYGGLRTMEQQAQLLKWEQDSVARGEKPYAVHTPNRFAAHTTGDAFDVRVNVAMDGLTVEETYKAMADFAPTLGLTAGYYFKTVPPDPFHFENKDRSLYDAPADVGVDPVPATPDGTPVDAEGAPMDTPSTGAASVPAITAVAIVGLILLAWWKSRHA